MNALTHLVGALGAAIGWALLVIVVWGDAARLVTLSVYGASMVLLYVTSTIFHGVKLPPRRRFWLNRADHVAIFVVIAGTYTPIVYHLFPQAWRWPVLAIIWGVALLGAAYKLFSRRIHGLFNASIYPLLSWAGVVPGLLAYRARPLVPTEGIWLLFGGGLIYMVGFVIYYRQRPDPWPRILGHHEIWHLCVMGGSLAHFLFMLFYVAGWPS